MRNDIVRVSKSDMFRIVQYDNIYAIQKHYPNGWRDCIDCQYCSDLNHAISEMNRKELELFIEQGW